MTISRKVVAITFILTVVAVVTAAAQSSVQASSPQPSISLSIQARHDHVKPGSHVLVDITLKNNTDEIIIVDRFSFDDITILDSRDTIPPLTERGRLASRQGVSRGGESTYWVEPGKSVTGPVNVSRVFDLSAPGEYRIQADRFDPRSRTLVKSNTVTVTVRP